MLYNAVIVSVYYISLIFVRSICAGKVWLGDNEVAWRTDQSFKRTSPLNPCATTTTTTTTGGGPLTHPHLSPPVAASVTTPDHRSPSSLHAKLGISPGEYKNLMEYIAK